MAVTFTVFRDGDTGKYAILDHTTLTLSCTYESIPRCFQGIQEGYGDDFDSVSDAVVWIYDETDYCRMRVFNFPEYPQNPGDFVDHCNEMWRISGEEN